MPSTKVTGGVAVGCCLMALVAFVLEVAATVWAILDLSGPNAHRVLDIVILVVVGLSVLGGRASRSSS